MIKHMKKDMKKVQSPREFYTSDDIRFILGRTAQQNDDIVREVQSINDNVWWFHADQVPSCHAILFTNNDKLTTQQIKEVSYKILEYSSKLKKLKKKQKIGYIIFTKIKNIRRTHIPGLVTHGRNKVKRFQIKL